MVHHKLGCAGRLAPVRCSSPDVAIPSQVCRCEPPHLGGLAIPPFLVSLRGRKPEAIPLLLVLPPAPACPACASTEPFVPRTPAARRCETAGTGGSSGTSGSSGSFDPFGSFGSFCSFACTCLLYPPLSAFISSLLPTKITIQILPDNSYIPSSFFTLIPRPLLPAPPPLFLIVFAFHPLIAPSTMFTQPQKYKTTKPHQVYN